MSERWASSRWSGAARRFIAVAGCGAVVFAITGCGGSDSVDAPPVVPPVITPLITTMAGTGVSGIAGTNGPAVSAEVSQVVCVKFDPSGNLYITDNYPSVVHKIASDTGTISIIAGNTNDGFSGNGGPAVDSHLYGVTGCATDSSGNLYVEDEANNQVRKIDASTGIISAFIGNAVGAGSPGGTLSGDGGPAVDAGINHPWGLSTDAAGNFYIADTGNNCIRRVDAVTGVITTIAGTGTSGYFGDGGLATAAELSVPEGVIVDPSGNVIIADYGNSVVRNIAAGTGVITTIAGVYAPGDSQGFSGDGGLATQAKLTLPTGLALNSSGDLYIADAGNQRIRKIAASTGIITTVVGTGASAYTGDGGPAIGAALHNPEGLTISNDGTSLYIADYYNYAVRKVTPLP